MARALTAPPPQSWPPHQRLSARLPGAARPAATPPGSARPCPRSHPRPCSSVPGRDQLGRSLFLPALALLPAPTLVLVRGGGHERLLLSCGHVRAGQSGPSHLLPTLTCPALLSPLPSPRPVSPHSSAGPGSSATWAAGPRPAGAGPSTATDRAAATAGAGRSRSPPPRSARQATAATRS